MRATAEPAFDCIVTPTVPLPVPDVVFSDAHGTPLEAVHEQFEPFVVTAMRPEPPAGPYGLPRLDVSTVTLHARASWVTWNAWPPIMSVPTRGTVVEFGATEYTRLPLASPLPPEVIEIQLGTDVVS